MLLLRKLAYARAGLVGNPSDGYGGKTIAVIVRNFSAEVVLYEWEDVELVWTEQDQNRFRSVHDLVKDVAQHGYYGGMRLIKATIKKFVEYCHQQNLELHRRNFSIRYQSTIPRQVGLAGSSAIIVATLRCLMDFYGIALPKEVQPSFVLSVETQELGITAGLQDRVIQVYEGLVYMDFGQDKKQQRHGLECYAYEPLDPGLLPPLYVAYKTEAGEPTEVFHNRIRERFEQGEPAVVGAMQRCAALAAQARTALLAGDADRLGRLMNENFDQRKAIYQLPRAQVEMVDVARGTGASAQFAGSGGTIIGIYQDEAMWQTLHERLGAIGCRVVKPLLN